MFWPPGGDSGLPPLFFFVGPAALVVKRGPLAMPRSAQRPCGGTSPKRLPSPAGLCCEIGRQAPPAEHLRHLSGSVVWPTAHLASAAALGPANLPLRRHCSLVARVRCELIGFASLLTLTVIVHHPHPDPSLVPVPSNLPPHPHSHWLAVQVNCVHVQHSSKRHLQLVWKRAQGVPGGVPGEVERVALDSVWLASKRGVGRGRQQP